MSDPNELQLTEISAIRAALSAQSSDVRALQARLQELGGLLQRGFLADRSALLAGLAAADHRHLDPLSLTRSYAQVYSQNGEDGMLAEIVRRVGARDRFFVEIGIEDGRQCNTRLLLESGWRGLWIEGNVALAEQAIANFRRYVDSGALAVCVGVIHPGNINAVLDRAQAPAAFDLLSLDIDQHTHNVWRALERPARIACIEYNASIPPSLPLEVPYDANAYWDGSNWFGAGLKALELIGAAKNLALVGCDLSGANAFFVAHEEAQGQFRAPFTAETHYQPPCYQLLAHAGHPPSPMMRHWSIATEVGAR